MIDRTTKILLGAIAAGLWANVAATQIQPAAADTSVLRSIDNRLSSTNNYLGALSEGICSNRKLC